MMIDPSTTNLLFAVSSFIAAVTGLASVIQNIMIAYQARKSASESKTRGTAIASQIAQVDVKVEAVAENTNGHMTTLIAAVAPVDPPLAAATMVKIQTVADTVKEKLEKITEQPPETKP